MLVECAAEQHLIKQHEVRVEPSGVIVFVMRGHVEAEDARALRRFYLDLARRMGRLHALLDTRQMLSISAEARRAFVVMSDKAPFAAVAMFGGSFALRTVVELLIRGGHTLAPQYFDFEHAWLANEAEARIWLERRRALAYQGQ